MKFVKKILLIILISLSSQLFAKELIIYRPENKGDMNDVRCYLKIQDENGNDVTYEVATATYEWAYQSNSYKRDRSKGIASVFQKTNLNTVNQYQKKNWYLSGGMAMHLNIKAGKYKISVYTPKEKHQYLTDFNSTDDDVDWESNQFEYNSENPVNVIFVSPKSNENGFYCGGWFIDYKAPEFYKFTKPKRE